MKILNRDVQRSENLITMIFLTLSGGLQDTYSYLVRGEVFANAQTGNIVLMSINFFKGEYVNVIKYFLPVLTFSVGIYTAEKIQARFKHVKNLHWRQIILLVEIFLLFLVAYIPKNHNNIANMLISFSCALQVLSFRKIEGFPFASTMCIGNIRNCCSALSIYFGNKSKAARRKAKFYFTIIFTFALGAGIGELLVNMFDIKLILLSCLLLFVSFVLMIKEK